MKKIILLMFLFLGVTTLSYSQKDATKTDTKKEATTKDAKEVKKSTGTNKDGSPDMRMKENKDAKAKADKEAKDKAAKEKTEKADKAAKEKAEKADKAAKEKTAKEAKATTTPQKPTSSTADKIVGKDAKGRTIYEGSKGGKYYINSSGNKEYIKN